MAVDRLLEATAFDIELHELRQRQRDLLRQHDRLTERMLVCPNDFGLAWARSLAAEIEGLGRRIEQIESQIL